jgi:ABC-type glycerol-3-phosphate transport system substrate-binding protein
MSRSRIVFFVIIGAAVLVVVFSVVLRPQLESLSVSQNATATAQYLRDNVITLTVNFGTEKQEWLEKAVAAYGQVNPNVRVVLDGQGSMESYQALSQVTDNSDNFERNRVLPTLWSPASSIQVNLLNAATVNSTLNRELATDCKRLVISPNVMMVWESRAKVFETYYKDKGGITFNNIVNALSDPNIQGRWEKLGGDAKWGLIKVGHTSPLRSNSGIMTLITLANNYYGKVGAISASEATDTGFADWLRVMESATTRPFISSTGLFADDVIAKGPSAYDFVLVYEALAVERYSRAIGRHQQTLRFIYPPYNMYTDHPMCVIDHPSFNTVQRDAARNFVTFLRTPEIQKLALETGWRPADLSIPVFGSGSKFDAPDLKAAGISADVGQELQIPDGTTINTLLTLWNRTVNQ